MCLKAFSWGVGGEGVCGICQIPKDIHDKGLERDLKINSNKNLLYTCRYVSLYVQYGVEEHTFCFMNLCII